MDITNAGFLTKLQDANSSVGLLFSSSATMPSTVKPAEVVHAVTKAYYDQQKVQNLANTAPPYINTVGPFVPQVVLFDAAGNPYQELVSSVRIRQQLAVDAVVGGEGLTIL